MAIIKFTNSKSSVKVILKYITQDSKTEKRLISGKDCVPTFALEEMEIVKNMYGKNNGRQYIHIVQAFDPKDTLDFEIANEIGVLLAERFVGFQAVIATHTDRKHIHNHILLNSVNFETGYKFQQSKIEMQAVKDFSDELCRQFGLGVIENPRKDGYISQGEYQTALKNESWKIDLMNTIDYTMSISSTKGDFISNMNRLGYDVNWADNRKNITYTTPDGKKCRDNKLHNDKYLKEVMERELRRTKEKPTGEIISDSNGQTGDKNERTNIGTQKNMPDFKRNANNPAGAEKISILHKLEYEKNKIRASQNKRLHVEKNNSDRGL